MYVEVECKGDTRLTVLVDFIRSLFTGTGGHTVVCLLYCLSTQYQHSSGANSSVL